MSEDSEDYTVTLNVTRPDGPSVLTGLIHSHRLILSKNECETIDLTPLASCKDLMELQLQENLLQKIDLTPLASCKDLRVLSLFSNFLQEIDLTPLASCKDLIALHLFDNKLHEIDLTPLSGCTNLKILALGQNQLIAINLAPLSGCKNLRRLALDQNQLMAINLAPLSECKILGVLDLYDNELVEIDLAPLSECTNLVEISLAFNQLKQIDLVPLSGCTNMTALALGNNQLKEIDLIPLSICNLLTTLYLSYNQLQEIDLTPLAKCINLESFYLSDNLLPRIDLTPLYECKFLTTFQFDRPIQLLADVSENEVQNAPPAIMVLQEADLITFGPKPEVITLQGKILLVGEMKSGKSSLLWRMRNLDAPPVPERPHYSTEGVEIRTLKLKNDSTVYVWDFGGQVEQSHIHRLFFSDQALYLFVFRPSPWKQVNFNRWFRMFTERHQQGGYFVSIKSCNSDRDAKQWSHTSKILESAIKTKNAEMNQHGITADSLHPDIFHVDSLEGTGVADLVDALPGLLEKAGARLLVYTRFVSDFWDYLQELLPKEKNDLCIITQEWVRQMLPSSLRVGISATLDILHHNGVLIYLPLIPLGISSLQRSEISKIAILNVELAGRLIYEIHTIASTCHGILRGKSVEELETKPIHLTCRDSWSGEEENLEIQASQVIALLDFMQEGDVAIHYNNRWLFPFSSPEELSDSVSLWNSIGPSIALQLEWDDANNICGSVRRMLHSLSMALNPKSVWQNGILFEIRQKPRTLIRIENITLDSYRTRHQKYILRIRNNDVNICSKHLQTIAHQLSTHAETGRIFGLEPRMVCPHCFTPLVNRDDGSYSCPDNSHGEISDTLQQASKSCYTRIKAFIPSPRTDIEDLSRQMAREHEGIHEHIDELKVFEKLLGQNDSSNEVIQQVEEHWNKIDSELLEPMRTLLQRYQETLQRSDGYLKLSKKELEGIINQLEIPKKEKKGVRGWLRDLPGELTVEILGNFLCTYGPTILSLLKQKKNYHHRCNLRGCNPLRNHRKMLHLLVHAEPQVPE